MTQEEVITEILSFAKRQKVKNSNGEYEVNLNSLSRHFASTFTEVDKRAVNEVIDEIDARGWLLKKDSTKIVFDPAAFD